MQLPSLLFVVLALASSHGTFGAPQHSHDIILRRHGEHRCKNKSWSPGASNHSGPNVEPSPSSHNLNPVNIVKPTTSSTVSTTSSAPAPTPTDAGDRCGVSSADQAAILKLHNDLRAKHDAPPLAWNDTLCIYAQNWIKECNFEHNVVDFGQNLAAGTGDYPFDQAFGAWADEEKDYNPQNPVYSHYTQLVWKDTQTTGCAVYQCAPGSTSQGDPFGPSAGSWDFWACNYYLPGNIEGEFPENVSK